VILRLAPLSATRPKYQKITIPPLTKSVVPSKQKVPNVIWGHFQTMDKKIYTVSQKNDTDVAHYNFNAHQPILVIFGRDIVE